MNNQPPPHHDDGLTNVALVLLAAAFGIVLDLWLSANAAAWLASRQTIDVGIDKTLQAIKNIPGHWTDPAAAWPEPAASRLPGPILYWTTTIAITALAAFLAWRLWQLLRPQPDTLDRRQRLGVDTQAKLADGKDLNGLVIRRPEPGRFLLGRSQHGKLLATEPHDTPTGTKTRAIPGPVALIGPSRSGKTHSAVVGINAWEGPAILSSVKDDLLTATFSARAALGEVKIYDPTHVTGLTSANWSPLARATDPTEAERTAELLIGAAAGSGTERDRFWSEQAVTMLGALLWTAAVTNHTMADLAHWITGYDQPTTDNAGTIAPLLRSLMADGGPHADQARTALNQLKGIWDTDSRMASSFYVSARLAVYPWTNHTVQTTAHESDIDIDWLLAGNNTLYLAAPTIDQARMAPALGGLIGDLMTQAIARGQAIRPELLVVLDEAANTPLNKLPNWASTVTGYGIQLVTIWQSKSQIDNVYGPREADTILTNARSKVFYSGMADHAGLQYVNELVGREFHAGALASSGRHRHDADDHTTPTAVDVVPPNVMRQIDVGEALLIHGRTKPIHLKTIDSIGGGRHWRPGRSHRAA